MEEDVEEFLSTIGDVLVKSQEIMVSNDMDNSTKQSQLVESMLNAASIDDHDDDEESSFLRWYYEIGAWVSLNISDSKKKNSRIHSLVKRDDRLTGLAYYAAFVSVKKCVENVVPKVSYSCYIDDTGNTIKSIQEEVLDCFNHLCKDLLIEKSWDVTGIRETILEARNFAINYINSSDIDKLCFPGNDRQRDLLLLVFKSYLIGNFEEQEEEEGGFLLKNNNPTDDMDDDLVGLSVDIQYIKDRLIGSNSNLDIIPIIGMGGIGKTTLAKKVYKDPQIMSLFLVHAWIVVSQEFQERDVYLGLLESIAPLPDEVYKEDSGQLAQRLYQRLKGWRYLIVLDDIWTTKAWDCINACFPNDNNGSRIMLTSRITKVASHIDPENSPHFMSFLRIEDSWKLLHKRIYGKEFCPQDMTNIGMQLAEKCQGLPLAIEVMAGYLSSISRTLECWEEVEKRVDFPTEANQLKSLSKILLISYLDLPHELKKCFLTMTLFPKNFVISVRKLIQMWTAMGFLSENLKDSKNDLPLDEVAMTYLKGLTDRSLIMVKEKKFDGKAKLCGVHDLLWDLSMREFCKQFSCDDDLKHVIRVHQCLLYFGHHFESEYFMNSEGFKQLRILDVPHQSFDHFPIEVTDLGHLRYLALSTSDNIPHLIYKLSYLETLLNYHERASQVLPSEIWLLAHLKNLHIGTSVLLCEPSNVYVEGCSNSLLPCLLSLYNLSLTSCRNEIFSHFPHLKQLGIVEDEQDDDVGDELLCSALENIINLPQLEKLKLCCSSTIARPRCIPNWGSFLPNTIKKLSLSHSCLPWSEMKTVATLPNLEVLKLKENAFKGEEWVMDDEEFLNLKYLSLESLGLIFWTANSDNFPNLQHIVINFCPLLCRIPREFGEIYTLELIHLELYVNSVYVSAIEIQREQMNLGNDKFKLQVGYTLPSLHTMGFVMVFVWMAMKLRQSS